MQSQNKLLKKALVSVFVFLSAANAFSAPACEGIFSSPGVSVTQFQDESMSQLLATLGYDLTPSVSKIPLTGVDQYLPVILPGIPAKDAVRVLFRLMIRDGLGKMGQHILANPPIVSSEVLGLVKGQTYNYVVTGEGLRIAPIGSTTVEDLLSKHLLLAANSRDVRCAGELWLDENASLNLNNNSGSFTPADANLPKLQELLRKNLGTIEIKVHGIIEDSNALTIPLSPFLGEVGWSDTNLRIQKSSLTTNNDVFFAENSNHEILGIFKGDKNSKPVRRFLHNWDLLTWQRTMEDEGLGKRSVAVWETAQAMGLDIVPITTAASTAGPLGKKGTVQAFLKNYVTADEASPEWNQKVSRPQAQRMFLFDTMMGMADRHQGNWMANSEGDLKLIDSDHVLYLTKKLRWQTSTPIESAFPKAKGLVENAVAQEFLNFKEDEFTKILRHRQIPEQAIQFALLRLRGIQAGLKSGKSIEAIMSENRLLAKVDYKGTLTTSTAVIFSVGLLYYLCNDTTELNAVPLCL